MKKIAIIFLLFLYLIPTIGFSVSAHYCGGKMTSLSLKLVDNHKCPCGSKKMKEGCCKDETKTFNLKNDQQKTTSVTCNFKRTTDLQLFFTDDLNLVYRFPIVQKSFAHSTHPPDNLRQPLYLLNQVFRV